ncbi:hypothetical protein D4764_07G0011840 [Takifugu flavidus]|uniref:Uncharacterized protein n=1 Tax=Takifugu flavidus TaxID=433684 RepID=A0A5C6MUD2_9TELE|nr:hypothetical protein D4764_07G0011840 [Takifugu flavidus]
MFLAVALVQWTWSLSVEKRWEGRRLEKLTSGTQIPALGKRSSAVSTAALIWADKVCSWVTLHLQLVICEWGKSAQIGVPQNEPLFSNAQTPILHFVICVDVSGGSACLRFRLGEWDEQQRSPSRAEKSKPGEQTETRDAEAEVVVRGRKQVGCPGNRQGRQNEDRQGR